MCINIWIHVCKWITCVQCLKKANEGIRSPGTVVSQLLAIPWDLGMEPRSSESALNHQVVSPVQAPQRSWALSPLLSLSLQFGAFAIFILVRLTARPNLSWWHAITDLGIGNCKYSSLAPTGAGLTPAHHCPPTCDNSSILTSLLGHLPFYVPEEWVAKTCPPFLYQWFLTGHIYSSHSLTNSLDHLSRKHPMHI